MKLAVASIPMILIVVFVTNASFLAGLVGIRIEPLGAGIELVLLIIIGVVGNFWRWRREALKRRQRRVGAGSAESYGLIWQVKKQMKLTVVFVLTLLAVASIGNIPYLTNALGISVAPPGAGVELVLLLVVAGAGLWLLRREVRKLRAAS